MTDFVSTGHLPAAPRVARLVDGVYERYRANTDGERSTVYPVLANASPDRFGICVAGTDGSVFTAGDADVEFTIMSVSKPFVFALVCDALGPTRCASRSASTRTGLPFNSLTAVELNGDGRTNPMVNPGAIATTSLVPGRDRRARRGSAILGGLSRFAGRDALARRGGVRARRRRPNHRNRGIARLLGARPDRLRPRRGARPLHPAVLAARHRPRPRRRWARRSPTAASTRSPASAWSMPRRAGYTLAVMTTAGLYETSGDWLYDVGLPGKSGIGGGIVTVAPGKGGLGTFAPAARRAGNSVKGQLVARVPLRSLGLDLFVSEPRPASGT